MKYVGSKARHANEFLPIILEGRTDETYVEPFVGGANSIQYVTGKRVGTDNNFYLIELFKALQQAWKPPSEVSKELYYAVKKNHSHYRPCMVGFVGFCCSFSGKWWGGYARGNDDRGLPRNYADEARRHLLKQLPLIQDVEFIYSNYKNLQLNGRCFVYCDPPYANTVRYASGSFDHQHFWGWVRQQVDTWGHSVFVSEYVAPDDFECVWEKEVFNTLDLNTGARKGVEKLWKKK